MKTKKTILITLMILFTFIICACNSHKEYQVGDLVTVKGVVYEYIDFSNIEQYKPFSFETKNEEQTIHSYYYYDMINEEQKEIIPYEDFYKNPNRNGVDLDEYFESVSRASDVVFTWQEDQYLSLKYYASYCIGTDNQKGFAVKGYIGNDEHVQIVESIGKDNVIAIGYRAFKENQMKRLTVNSRVLVLPEAISECPNLTYIDFKGGAALLSKAISQNPKLDEITSIRYISDACLYDLPSLRIVDLKIEDLITQKIEHVYEQTLMGGIGGIYKAPLYLCPKVRMFGDSTTTQKNVVYKKGYSLYMILHVMDDYLIDLDDKLWFNGLFDSETNTMLPSFLNTGYDISGTLCGGSEPHYYREDGKLFNVNYSRNRLAFQDETRPTVQIIQKRIS